MYVIALVQVSKGSGIPNGRPPRNARGVMCDKVGDAEGRWNSRIGLIFPPGFRRLENWCYSALSAGIPPEAGGFQGRARGPMRLQRTMNQIAAMPSFHPIFFPSAYVRPS